MEWGPERVRSTSKVGLEWVWSASEVGLQQVRIWSGGAPERVQSLLVDAAKNLAP